MVTAGIRQHVVYCVTCQRSHKPYARGFETCPGVPEQIGVSLSNGLTRRLRELAYTSDKPLREVIEQVLWSGLESRR